MKVLTEADYMALANLCQAYSKLYPDGLACDTTSIGVEGLRNLCPIYHDMEMVRKYKRDSVFRGAQMIPGEEDNILLEPGGTEVNTAAGGARRYRKPLKSFRWCDIKPLFFDSFDEWSRQKAPRLGASLAFYTLLSLAPLLLVLVSIVSLVFGQSAAHQGVVQQVGMLVGPQGAKATEALLAASRNTTHGIVATVLGLVTLLFGAREF